MTKTLRLSLVVLGAFALAAPAAQATTTIGSEGGAGTDPGTAIKVTGDGGVNHVVITLTQSERRGLEIRITDRRGRVKQARGLRCPSRGRHTVVCRGATPYARIRLRGGDDRLTVRTVGSVSSSSPLIPDTPLPDALATIPSDEGDGGSFLGWIIDGGAGDDRISGSPSFDHIIGGPGSDVLYGRGGDDVFDERGEAGADEIFGGRGHDALVWRTAIPLHVDLSSGAFSGGTLRSVDKVQGGDGDDTLTGSSGAELLQGAGGADAIAGRGGADVLVGDGVFTLLPGADTIDGGPGNDLLDVSNKAFEPYGPVVAATRPGPPDVLACGDGRDRVDARSTQPVPADCEGARFIDADTTVPLRPTLAAAVAFVFDVPCPARDYFRRAVTTCSGTLTLSRSSGGAALGSAQFSAGGGTRAAVAVVPTLPIAPGELVSVQIAGRFGGYLPDDTVGGFEFGWATAF